MPIKNTLRSRFLGLFAACGAAAASGGACAQEGSDAAASSTSDGKAAVEEVVVTGSRVVTNGNDSPTPVTVLSVEQLLQANPGPIAQGLAMMPALLGPPNQGGQSGANYQAVINLRGMGGTRNLILFDGHRVAPTTAGGGVDTNLLPSMLLKRVDIVTGGASAVYGSDAVSGVVNYIVDNNFNGIKVSGQTGATTYGDDHTWNVGFAAGTSLFGGRAHVEFSYQNYRDPGIACRCDRDWGRGLWTMQGSVVGSTASAGTAANPWKLYSNSHFNVTTYGGMINTGPLSGLQFTQNNVLTSFVHGTLTGSPQAEVGGDGAYYTTYSAYGIQNMDQGFGRFDFNFTDNVRAYVEVAASTVLNRNVLANAEVRTRAVGYNNAFLAAIQSASQQATIAAQRAANPLGSFNFSRIFTADQFAPPTNNVRGKQFLYLAGVEGSLGDYKWEVGVEHSDATTTTTNPNNIHNGRLFAAMNAVVNPANGQIACNAALVNPAVYGTCVPLNLFGPTATNQAAVDYVRQETQFAPHYLMDNVTASITGAPFSTWAGPVQMALSGEWRRLSYEVESSASATDALVCTGIQFNCTATGAVFNSAVTSSFPKSSLSVKEFAYETQVPLLREQFLARSLSLNGAIRYTDYSASGIVYTWKLGLTWALGDSFSVRGTRSRDIRAPSIQNLFAPASVGVSNITDIHTGGTGNVSNISRGNPNLTPEKANTWTAGFVWTPQYLPGFSLSMDGYRIDIKDALNGLSPALPPAQTACELSNGTSQICDSYIRPLPFSDRSAANFPTAIVSQTLNTGGLLAYGVDIEFSYSRLIVGRDFRARLLANYQPHLIYDLGPSGILDIGGAADGIAGLYNTPSVKAMAQLNYEVLNNFTATAQVRYRNSMKQNGSPVIIFDMGKVPEIWYTDLTMNYKLSAWRGEMDAFANVRNLFNQQPVPYAVVGGAAQIGSLGGYVLGDDVLGRYYTLGLRYKF
jgi:iron complex outermembrane receptor protein